MKLIILNETDFTPALHLDPNKLLIELKGVSRPENVGLFYTQIVEWIDEVKQEISSIKATEFHLVFKLTYCNSASMKFILMILEKVISFREFNIEPKVDWYYDEGDDQMLEDGEDVADAAEIEFNFHPVSS